MRRAVSQIRRLVLAKTSSGKPYIKKNRNKKGRRLENKTNIRRETVPERLFNLGEQSTEIALLLD